MNGDFILELRKPKNYSISQLNKYDDCPRMHYYQYVCGLEVPSTSAQDYGKQCHSYLEQYLKGDITEFPNDYHGRTCKAGLSFLPQPKSGEVEKFFEMNLTGLVVPIIGYMDYCSFDERKDSAVLLDHKIVKTDQYALTEDKLAKNNQVITYSKFLLDYYNTDMVQASYLYFKRGGSWVNKVTVELTRKTIETEFQVIADKFESLQNNYNTQLEDNVPQILSSCSKWGGCPFKDKCWGTQKGDTMSLLDKLLANAPKPKTNEGSDHTNNLLESLTQKANGTTQADTDEAKQARLSIFNQIQKIQIKPVGNTQQSGNTDDLFGSLDNVETTDSGDSWNIEDEDEDEVNLFQVAAESEVIPKVLVSDAQKIDLEWSEAKMIDTQDIVTSNPVVIDEVETIDIDNSAALAEIKGESLESIYEEDNIQLDTQVVETVEQSVESQVVETVEQSVESQVVEAVEQTVELTSDVQADNSVIVDSQNNDISESNVETDDDQDLSGFSFADADDNLEQDEKIELSWLSTPIDQLSKLANRPKNTLSRHGFVSLNEVLDRYPVYSYLRDSTIKGFGKSALDDFILFIQENTQGLNLDKCDPNLASFVRSIPVIEPSASLLVIDSVLNEEAGEQQAPVEAVVEEQQAPVEAVVEEQQAPVEAVVEEQQAPVEAVVEEQQAPVEAVVEEQQATIEVNADNKEESTASSNDDSVKETQPKSTGNEPSSSEKTNSVQPAAIPKIVLIGCIPIKGLSFVAFEELIVKYEQHIEKVNQVPHISLIDYSKGYDYLAAMIKNDLANNNFDWSKTIYISAQATITYSKSVHAVIQKADIVIKNA